MNRAFYFLLFLGALPAFAFQDHNDSPAPTTELFQVVLLSAATDSLGAGGDIPENVKSALEDVSDFLPYKHFKLLDAAILRTNRVGRTLVHGPNSLPCQVTFTMEKNSNDPSRILIRKFQLASDGGNLIDSSFDIRKGETVVVGTSRLNGANIALMVLLTAK